MRIGDSNATPTNIFSSIRSYDIGKLEILRGPQGAIYGGESAGGVIWLETPRGAGAPHARTFLEAGSFNSLATHGIFQGETKDINYYLAGGYEETANDGADQDFNQSNAAMRVEGKVSDIWTLGTTFRGADVYYENKNSPEVDNNSYLSTLYATGKISDAWTARFHLGYQKNAYDTKKAGVKSSIDSDVTILSTDHEITLAENLRLLAGAFIQNNSYDNGTFDESGERFGIHSALEWDIIENLTASTSLRWEDYDYFGDALTWRAGGIYNLPTTGTTFRGGFGSSFRAPSYLEVYGNPGWSINSNPNIKEETSLGWDLGVEQQIGDHHQLGITWFHNNFSDRIDFYTDPNTFQSQFINLSGNSITEGLEFALQGNWLDDSLVYNLAWTYLHKSLSDHPRNSFNASIDWKATDKLTVGVGANHMSTHSWGNDPSTFKDIKAYSVARIHASYQITEHVKIHGRIENALDENYLLSDIYGTKYEGAGTGFYAGITVDW